MAHTNFEYAEFVYNTASQAAQASMYDYFTCLGSIEPDEALVHAREYAETGLLDDWELPEYCDVDDIQMGYERCLDQLFEELADA